MRKLFPWSVMAVPYLFALLGACRSAESEYPKQPSPPGPQPDAQTLGTGSSTGQTTTAAAPAIPPGSGITRLSTKVGHSLLAINPQRPPYKVTLPREYFHGGREYEATILICVSEVGSVSNLRILRPSIPAINEQLPVAVGQWRFRQYLVDGLPTPFCYAMNYRVR